MILPGRATTLAPAALGAFGAGSYADASMSDSDAITTLLFRYAELMDLGDFAAVADLFRHARIRIGPGDEGVIDAAAMRDLWERNVIRYDDGTPRTKHVTTNAIVEIEPDGRTARARSYYTVFQQVPGVPLQPIIAGRYHDRFERVDGDWWFAARDYTLVDLVGDLSRHLRIDVASR
jgi:3-phenylpropionate/cinnamic acid dioxygenase small subunit